MQGTSVSAVILVCESLTRMVNNLSSTYVHYHEHLEGDISPTIMDTANNSVGTQDANYTSILYDVTIQSCPLRVSITLWIWKIFPIFLLTFGTFGNVITIIVLLRHKLRNNSTTLYLLVLAVTDLTVLYFGLLRQYLRKIHDKDFRVSMGCGFHLWLVYTSVAYSSWLLVALTMDRFVSVKFPVYVRNRNSRRCNIIVIIVLLLVIGLVNSHFIYGWERREYTFTSLNMTISYCDMKDSFYHLHETVWPWVDLCIVSIIPFILVGIGNCSIGHNLIERERSKRLHKRRSSVHDKRNSLSQQRSTTKLLFVLSVVFFITTLPASLYLVIISFVHSTDDEALEKFNLFWAIASFFMYTNNAINFILYCVSAKNFRREFKTMLKEMLQWVRKQWDQTCVRQEKNQTLKRLADSIHVNARKVNKVSPSSADVETALNISSVAEAIKDELADKKDDVFITVKTEETHKQMRSNCYTEIEMLTPGLFEKSRRVSFQGDDFGESVGT